MTTTTAQTTPRRRGKIFVLLFLILVLLPAIGLGILYFTTPILDNTISQVLSLTGKKKIMTEQIFFSDIDEMIIAMPLDGGRQKFLKIRLSLETTSVENYDKVNELIPRLMDSYQLFLRELRPSELEGSKGMYQIKEELITRTNLIISPAKINNILFRELIIQ